MYVSIDLVEEVIERQIRRYRKKLIDKKQAAISFSQAFIEEEDEVQDDEIQIVKTKKFAIKPTIPEEACLQMEMLCLLYTSRKSSTSVLNPFFSAQRQYMR